MCVRWLLRPFVSSKKQMSDGIRCTADALGESSVEYQEERKQRSVGRAFSPHAGEKPLRGEREGEGIGQEGPQKAEQLKKASARQAGSLRAKVPSSSQESCVGWGWPSSRTWAVLPRWLTVA